MTKQTEQSSHLEYEVTADLLSRLTKYRNIHPPTRTKQYQTKTGCTYYKIIKPNHMTPIYANQFPFQMDTCRIKSLRGVIDHDVNLFFKW